MTGTKLAFLYTRAHHDSSMNRQHPNPNSEHFVFLSLLSQGFSGAQLTYGNWGQPEELGKVRLA